MCSRPRPTGEARRCHRCQVGSIPIGRFCPRHLVAKDATLSRWSRPVRIRPGTLSELTPQWCGARLERGGKGGGGCVRAQGFDSSAIQASMELVNRSEAGKRGYKKAKAALTRACELRHAEGLRRWNAKNLRCPACGQRIPYEKRRNKFCDSSCAARITNVGVCRNPRNPNRLRGCIRCRRPSSTKFCAECRREGWYLEYHLTFENLKADTSRRAFLLRTDGHVCSACSLSTWMGQPIPLELDHIDGNPRNNSRGNLRLLCPNCHAQTPTYKGKNVGNGRKHRRDRYHREKLASEA